MNLTTEFMRQYVGGQVEIVGNEDYRYRGQIKDIQIIPDPGCEGLPGQSATLHVEFDYICKFQPGVGYQPDENKPYDLSLAISGVNEIGRGPHVDKGPSRLAVNCSIVGEMSVFYPPEHDRRVLENGMMEILGGDF